MVQKVGKHGVRSGNTFKASNSTYLRRYRTQSCLLRQFISNGQGPDVMPKEFDSVDGIPSNNVPYSLNKKGRWNLPAMIKENILHGDHIDDEYGIQLIERHKINKQADCVGVFSTTGFLKEVSVAKSKFKSKSKRRRTGYIHAHSVLNATRSLPRVRIVRRRVARDIVPSVDLNTPPPPSQVRYDVLYPSPVTSSITHNPKYVGYETTKPVTSGNHKGHRGKQRNSRKMADMIQESISCMDDELDDFEEENDASDVVVVTTEKDTTIALEEILKLTKSASNLSNSRVRMRNASIDNTDSDLLNGKGHVIYAQFEQDNESEDNTTESAVSGVTAHYTELIPVLVILQTEQMNPQALRQHFGNRLIECECFPRKFIIDISEQVSGMNMFKVCTREGVQRVTASLVFVHDIDNEINNLKEDVYKVSLNTHFDVKIQSVKIETLFDYMETSVDEIVNRTLFFIETLPTDALVSESYPPDYTSGRSAKYSLLEECASWQTNSYRPDDLFLLQSLITRQQDTTDASALGYEVISHFDSFTANETADVASPKSRFCSICYDSLENNKTATALISCCHWFCDDCWGDYLETKVHSGTSRVVCPEYDCSKSVDPGTLLSLINIRGVIKLAKRCHDAQIEKHVRTRWCPNEICGRVLHANSANVKTGQCHCGKKLCFDCLGKPHWPAPCKSVTDYQKRLKDSGLLHDDEIVTPVVVHGKQCPHCNTYVTKNGGCPSMVCVCGKPFCWGCGKAFDLTTQHTFCQSHGYHDKHKTVPKHVGNPLGLENELKLRGSALENWYKMAVRHRIEQTPTKVRKMKLAVKEMSKKIQYYMVRSAQKGETVLLDFEFQGKTYVREADKTPDFLKNMINLHTELNHLVENTAVLLNSDSLRKVSRLALQQVVSRLSTFATIIFDLFTNADNKHAKDLIRNFKEVRFHSRKTIQGLVKCVTALGL